MTALDRVHRTRWILGAAAIAQALAWGVAAALAVLAVIAFASLAVPPLGHYATAVLAVAVAFGAGAAAFLLWRSRGFVSASHVALWIEERIPELHYSLVTALEQGGSPFAEEMLKTVARHNVRGATLTAIRRPMLVAAAALVIAMVLLFVSPPGAFGRVGAFSTLGRFGAGVTPSSGSRLDDIEVRITPPAYTGERGTTLRDPSSIAALTGSTIAIRGKGSANGVSAVVSGPIRIIAADGGWAASLVMPATPAALKLEDRDYDRVIVLAPRADAPPGIRLITPAHDTALRTPRLVVQLSATATDDIGLGEGHFEYLITTGSGEIFSARTINTPTVRFGGAQNGSLSATLDLASLGLVEGDFVSMRAVAQDGNTLSGPGIASSDTRTIRIVRASEYDSLAIEAAAPQPIDSSAMSQRMLIVMTEQLVRELPKLAREELVKRSTDIGDLEERIRRRVHEILTQSEEENVEEKPGTPPPSIEEMEAPEEITGAKNPDLVTAYNALWEAVRSLKIAEPAPALPPMRVALKALDRARVANRLYLRGAPPRIIVDLKRVRLTGKERGHANERSPRGWADSTRVRLSARFDAALDLIAKDPARAISELALLRVDALSSLPAFADALGEASDAIRARRDATLPLLRARRALDGSPEVTPALSPWSGGGEE